MRRRRKSAAAWGRWGRKNRAAMRVERFRAGDGNDPGGEGASPVGRRSSITMEDALRSLPGRLWNPQKSLTEYDGYDRIIIRRLTKAQSSKWAAGSSKRIESPDRRTVHGEPGNMRKHMWSYKTRSRGPWKLNNERRKDKSSETNPERDKCTGFVITR